MAAARLNTDAAAAAVGAALTPVAAVLALAAPTISAPLIDRRWLYLFSSFATHAMNVWPSSLAAHRSTPLSMACDARNTRWECRVSMYWVGAGVADFL